MKDKKKKKIRRSLELRPRLVDKIRHVHFDTETLWLRDLSPLYSTSPFIFPMYSTLV